MGKEKILLVEGINDRSVIQGLMSKHNVAQEFTFAIATGVDNLFQQLDLYLKNTTAYGVIGIVVDADKDANSRWQQFKDRLNKTGKYDCKQMSLVDGGMIIEAVEKDLDAKVGIWIMPNNKYKGTLENFLLKMIPKDDKLINEVERELTYIESEGLRRYRDVDRNKAKVQTFLAWGNKPGISINTAILSRVLDSNSDIAMLFIGWLIRLFKNY